MAPFLNVPDSEGAHIQFLRQYVNVPDLGVSAQDLSKMDMRGKFRVACASWARYGLGGGRLIHGYYLFKVIVYVIGFWLFQARRSGPRTWSLMRSDLDFRRDAFRRLVIYNLLFEVLGLGCGSGPLTGRLIPPHTSWFHFLCPGTLKLPLRANPRDSQKPLLPMLSTRRNKFDVLLFIGYLASLFRALLARRVTAAMCQPVCAFLGVLAVVDHTVFLASRGDVYGYMAVASAAGAPAVGAQLVQLAVYFWAAFSKLGPWFNNVIQVMLSNSPVFPPKLRDHLYMDIDKGDFRPSIVAKGHAALGTIMEFSIPALLPLGGSLSRLGMFLSINMHTFIFANFAVGCPQEWNVFTPISAYHLFLDSHDGLDWRALRALPSAHPLLAAFLFCVLGVVPTMGNLMPYTNSFLTSMKYYAGNWPATVWLVRKSAWHKLHRLTTLSDYFPQQAAALLGDELLEVSSMKVYAFRALHLPYRGLPKLVEIALQGRPFDDYQFADGETMAGVILGYNFGDGYQHGRFMVQAVQDICCFEEGELLHISIDSCPAHGDKVPWFVRDATRLWDDDFALGIGQTPLSELQEQQPF